MRCPLSQKSGAAAAVPAAPPPTALHKQVLCSFQTPTTKTRLRGSDSSCAVYAEDLKRAPVSVSPNLPENYRYFAAKFCFGLVDNLLGNAGTGRYFARICSCFDTLILSYGVQGAICGS